MLSISTKTQYGLLALLDLTDHFGKGLVQINDIVQRRNVPKSYLEQILNRLTKTGIIQSVRGNKGGYKLGCHPDDLTLLRVIESLEGEMQLHNNKVCVAMGEILEKAERAVKELLQTSLSELNERQKALEQQIMFSI